MTRANHEIPATSQPENIGAYRRFRLLFATMMWDIIQNHYQFELSNESRDNLQLLNEVLSQAAAVVYINHVEFWDPAVVLALILGHLPNVNNLMGPAGMKHFDWRRDPIGASTLRILKILKVKAIPIVQIDDKGRKYSKHRRKKMSDQLKNETIEVLRQPENIYGITPEGTRNGGRPELIRAKKGVGRLEEYDPGDNLHYVPIAIMYPKHTQQPKVAVGKPKKLSEIIPPELVLCEKSPRKAQQIADLLMLRLAALMPEDLRGYYADPKQIKSLRV